MALIRIKIADKPFFMVGDHKVYYDEDPITGKRLVDPYHAEAIKYAETYYKMIDESENFNKTGEGQDNSRQLNLMPQPGPQWHFLRNSADIIIYGGSAGAGKTYAITLEGLRNLDKDRHTAVVFRRNKEMHTKPGGPWSEGVAMYSKIPGSTVKDSAKEFHFDMVDDNGKKVKGGIGPIIKYDGLEYLKDRLSHQGAQYATIIWDELTHFEEEMFTYLMSRNRSPTGHKCSVKATTNPETGSWVRDWIDWWIWPKGSVYPEGYLSPTGEDISGMDCAGLPIRERSGKIRHMLRTQDEDDNEILNFRATLEELIEEFGESSCYVLEHGLKVSRVKTFTFISASIFDNPKLLESNPGYVADLASQPKVVRDQLLGGNWDTTVGGGLYFKRGWVEKLPRFPSGPMSFVRYWDRAATKPGPKNKNPDWTVGALLAKDHLGTTYVVDIVRFRDTPKVVEQTILATAGKDPKGTTIWLEEEPGGSGKAEISNYMRLLSAYPVRVDRVTKNKLTRGLAFSAACEHDDNLVVFIKGKWNDVCFTELENFDPDCEKFKDDQWDAVTGGYNALQNSIALPTDIDYDVVDELYDDEFDEDCIDIDDDFDDAYF